MSDEDVQKESTGDEAMKNKENTEKSNVSESTKIDAEKPANGHHSPSPEEDSKSKTEEKDILESKEVKAEDEKENEEKMDSKTKSDESVEESEEIKTSVEDSKVDSTNDSRNETDSKIEDEDESMEVSKDETLEESRDESDDTPEKPKKKGILEQPVEMRGKRDRKKVERYEQETKKEEVVAEGEGTPFKDIPFIHAMIQKTPVDDLKVLHRLGYGRPGTANEIKKNLYKFKGLPFSREEKAFERKRTSLEKVVMSELKKIALILGLERSGVKSDLVERILDFLLYPQDMGKDLPKASRRSSTSKGKKSKSKKKKVKGTKEPEEDNDDENEDDEDEDEEEEEEDEEKNEEEKEEEEEEEEEEKSESDSEDDEPVKKTKKKAPKATPRKTPQAKKTPKAKAGRTPKSQSKKRPKQSDSDDDISEDSDASEKKPKKKAKTSSPTDSEIKSFIKKLLDKADLEEVTMKKLCQQVYDNYPGQDLSHKKDFIKTTVKSILS